MTSLARSVLPALLLAALLPAVTSVTGATGAAVARGAPTDETTTSQNNLRERMGPGRDQPHPGACCAAGGTFGQLFSTAVTGRSTPSRWWPGTRSS